jgi:hypothetical protein
MLSCGSKSFESGRLLQYISTICTAQPSSSEEAWMKLISLNPKKKKTLNKKPI